MSENWSVEWEQGMVDYECAQEVPENEVDEPEGEYEPENDVPLDGDAESALASCGWGTDEDYGYFGGDEW